MTNTKEARMADIKLPLKHAQDWFQRCCDWEHGFQANGGPPDGSRIVTVTARTVTLSLSGLALKDLLSDAAYYATEMGPEDTGGIDYRPAARRCLAALARLGYQPHGW